MLVTAGDDHVVRLWDVAQAKLVDELSGHRDWVRSATFTADGHALVTAGLDGQVLYWAINGGRQPRLLFRQEKGILDFALTRHALVVASLDTKLNVIPVGRDTSAVELSWDCHELRSMAVAPHGELIACGSRDGTAYLFSLSTGELLRTIPAHQRPIRAVAFAANESLLVTGGDDRNLRVWNVETGELEAQLSSGRTKTLTMCALGERRLASAGSDNLIRVWNLTTGQLTATLAGHTGSVAALATNGAMLASGSYDTTVCIWVVPSEGLITHRRPASDDPREDTLKR